MSTIDDLLAHSLLLREPHVPADVVPHDEALDDDLLLWQHRADDTFDNSAAHSLHALCETVVSHCTPDELADFLTDQIPQPGTARILGCALHLAGIDIGARFWWQYAAGAEDAPASYCLYLQHLAHGETHAAALWHAQTGAHTPGQADIDAGAEDYAPALQSMSADSSLATVLRVLAQLTRTMPTRRHTPAARAVIEFVASAVAGGYARHPDLEIPLPGTFFAEQLEIVVAATTGTRDQARPAPVHATTTNASSPTDDLPNRLASDEDRKHIPTKATLRDPEHLLVQVTAADHEPTTAHTFFEDAAAICWRTATEQDTRGNGMAYRLRRFAQRLSPAPSGFGQLRTASASGSAPIPFHQL